MIEKIVTAVCLIFGGGFLYLMLVILPVAIYADAKCLRAGYPMAHVTVGLEIYCSTLDGAVTVKVDKLP